MKDIKRFFLGFLDKEAEAWTRRHLNDIDAFNRSIRELYSMAIDDLDEAFGIFEEDELAYATGFSNPSKFSTSFKELIKDNPKSYAPRHLFKLSKYSNDVYGDIWLAYVSGPDPVEVSTECRIFECFIISEVDDTTKIVGIMHAELDELTMEPAHWTASMYNPSDLDIKNLGEFVAIERYKEPKNDGFSMEDYLKDK